MAERSLLWHIGQLRKPFFTTHELCVRSGKSQSNIVQTLRFLEREGVVVKVRRGIWAKADTGSVSLYTLIPYLEPTHRVYVSFISALHLYGIIEQIPQVVTLASTAHSKVIRTSLGVFDIHQISPPFFGGFNWYKEEGAFLIAEPEKALIDSLYLSTRRKKQFGYFPELRFSESFSFKKAANWIKKIPEPRIRSGVRKRYEKLLGEKGKDKV